MAVGLSDVQGKHEKKLFFHFSIFVVAGSGRGFGFPGSFSGF